MVASLSTEYDLVLIISADLFVGRKFKSSK